MTVTFKIRKRDVLSHRISHADIATGAVTRRQLAVVLSLQPLVNVNFDRVEFLCRLFLVSHHTPMSIRPPFTAVALP